MDTLRTERQRQIRSQAIIDLVLQTFSVWGPVEKYSVWVRDAEMLQMTLGRHRIELHFFGHAEGCSAIWRFGEGSDTTELTGIEDVPGWLAYVIDRIRKAAVPDLLEICQPHLCFLPNFLEPRSAPVLVMQALRRTGTVDFPALALDIQRQLGPLAWRPTNNWNLAVLIGQFEVQGLSPMGLRQRTKCGGSMAYKWEEDEGVRRHKLRLKYTVPFFETYGTVNTTVYLNPDDEDEEPTDRLERMFYESVLTMLDKYSFAFNETPEETAVRHKQIKAESASADILA